MTRTDWRTINRALALLEADVEGTEPDEYAPAREHAAWRRDYARLQLTRRKVHELLEKRGYGTAMGPE